MVTKTKITKSTLNQLISNAQQVGLVAMTAAATLGMLELPDHTANKIVVASQPAFALAGENANLNEEFNNPIRREKEEVEEHYISYSVAQRTPGRHGKV
ncbi:MAG TPA: hypothetical protein VG604_02140 [Candidatus Saccharimonadales bacterium]|nr:hypothetical protein [Candidatus Saccharimonadales bacterium]